MKYDANKIKVIKSPDNIIDLVKEIEESPSLYLVGRSIFYLRAFIDGWYFRNTNIDVKMDALMDFNSWLQKRNKLPDDFTWEKIILLYSQDEFVALNNFFSLFNKFIIETNYIDSNTDNL